MKVGTIGYNYSHDSNFEINRPYGNGCFLFLIIKTPAIFTVNNKIYNVKEQSFIIFTPEMPCNYHASEKIYTDDWIYFSADENDKKHFEEMGITLNEPIYLGNIEELSQIVHIMAYELYTKDNYCEEIVSDYFEILVMKLSRLIRTKSAVSSHSFMKKNHRMTELRTRIITEPERIGSIDELADEMGMSRSGFGHLYKKMFGVSVMEDIINGKMERAKSLLSSTNLTVCEVADRCGYINEYSFMKQFKKKCGKTPTEYRQMI